METDSNRRATIAARMAKIVKKNTKPEIAVRRMLHAAGYGYRLHRADLPGTPDIALASRRKVIFVHGCFWHRHHCRAGVKSPSANPAYWLPKFERIKARDAAALEQLSRLGWSSLIVWECELHDPPAVQIGRAHV